MGVTPDIVQVVPHEDHTVSVYFCDGKIVIYDVRPKLEKGVFRQLADISFFMERCTIMNDTLAWDITGTGDNTKCIDIDPEVLYALEAVDEKAVC
ncbi:MAG: DUF2442 domain-containing protein [Lachnospiraceae bacterium]|nr:DUF2442 domain-containing protein [Lachnospiraceae bacterium]